MRHGGAAIPLSVNLLKLLFKVEHCFCLGFRCVLVLLGWLWAYGVEVQELRMSKCVGITSLCWRLDVVVMT